MKPMIAIQMKEMKNMSTPTFTCIRHKHIMLEGLERIISLACKWMSQKDTNHHCNKNFIQFCRSFRLAKKSNFFVLTNVL